MKRLSVIAVVGLLGGLFAIGSGVTPTEAAAPYCTGTINGGTLNTVIVPSGAECILNGVTTIGGVTQYPDSALYICDSTIGGWLRVNRGYVNVDYGTTINGGADIIPPAGTIEYSGTTQKTTCGPDACDYQLCEGLTSRSGVLCPYKVNGPVNVHNGGPNALQFQIGGCGYSIFGNSVNITYNSVSVYIQGSKVKGNLMCYFNNPAALRNSVHVLGQSQGCVEQEMN